MTVVNLVSSNLAHILLFLVISGEPYALKGARTVREEVICGNVGS